MEKYISQFNENKFIFDIMSLKFKIFYKLHTYDHIINLIIYFLNQSSINIHEKLCDKMEKLLYSIKNKSIQQTFSEYINVLCVTLKDTSITKYDEIIFGENISTIMINAFPGTLNYIVSFETMLENTKHMCIWNFTEKTHIFCIETYKMYNCDTGMFMVDKIELHQSNKDTFICFILLLEEILKDRQDMCSLVMNKAHVKEQLKKYLKV